MAQHDSLTTIVTQPLTYCRCYRDTLLDSQNQPMSTDTRGRARYTATTSSYDNLQKLESASAMSAYI